MRMQAVSAGLICFVLFLPVLRGQSPPCTSRALKTVEEAQTKFLSGDGLGAKELLASADRECGDSYPVLQNISAVYQLMGESVLANVYAASATKFGGATDKAKAESQAPNAPGAEIKTVVREKYALVVGIQKFKSDRIPRLKYSAKDAQDFARLLSDPDIGRFKPQNVTLLTDENATARAIRSALYDIAAKALEDDLIVLYFSTHGSSPSMDHSKVGAGYLITYDADVDELYGSAYGMDELARFMKQNVRAKRIVTFLDTCYSGDTTRFMRTSGDSKALIVEGLSSDSIGEIAQGEGSVVITSSTNQELSWESDEGHNSFFTLQLLASMRKRKGLGTLDQMYTDIQRSIPLAVKSYTHKKGLGPDGLGLEQNPAIYPMTHIPDIVIGAPTE